MLLRGTDHGETAVRPCQGTAHRGARRLSARQRLPSRAALAERFGVNRTTIERAVSELIGEGLLYARDKSGTYTTGRLPAAHHAEGGRRWAVVIPDIQHDTYPGIIRGIQDAAGDGGST